MTNFKPLKNYIFHLFNKLDNEFSFKSPFLDAGCGVGDFSYFLSEKDLIGDAIDFSEEAIKITKEYNKKELINVILGDATEINKKYNLIILMDVIEHIKEDKKFIENISNKLNNNGYIFISVPNNPDEWAWDDEHYGHFRRYTKEQIRKILRDNNLEVVKLWDFTFPIFYWMRKLSLKFMKPISEESSKENKTKKSSLNPYWERGLFSKIISNLPIWKLVYWIQFKFRNGKKGHEIIVLGKKI